MRLFLQLPSDDQKLTIEQTAARIGWAASSVEKDFWVCWTLQKLFAVPELAPHLTFKGGTSLSKAWGLIGRFSEDIDLTITCYYMKKPTGRPKNHDGHGWRGITTTSTV